MGLCISCYVLWIKDRVQAMLVVYWALISVRFSGCYVAMVVAAGYHCYAFRIVNRVSY